MSGGMWPKGFLHSYLPSAAANCIVDGQLWLYAQWLYCLDSRFQKTPCVSVPCWLLVRSLPGASLLPPATFFPCGQRHSGENILSAFLYLDNVFCCQLAASWTTQTAVNRRFEKIHLTPWRTPLHGAIIWQQMFPACNAAKCLFAVRHIEIDMVFELW